MTVVEAIIPCISVAYWTWSAVLVRRRTRRGGELVDAHGTLPAVTFFRPLKPDVPDLKNRLREFIRTSVSKEDQAIIGVAEDSPELEIAQWLATEFPDRAIEVIGCKSDLLPNPKVSKLVQMALFAQHERWIIMDSEFIPEPNWVEAFRREWHSSRVDTITAGYRFVGMKSFPECLDAIGALQTLWPGLAVLEQQRKPAPLLGAVIGTTREDVEAVGGWQSLGDYLADDNELGTRLMWKRRRVRLSHLVASLSADHVSWRAYWQHQRRVALTYRVCNPSGFAGMVLTYGITFALVIALLRPTELIAWLVLAGVVLARAITARSVAKSLRFYIPALGPVSVIGSVVESICWVLAWFQREVVWGGRRYRVWRNGTLS